MICEKTVCSRFISHPVTLLSAEWQKYNFYFKSIKVDIAINCLLFI
jgi:hypothetical protein